MHQPGFTSSELPEHHRGMLILKMRGASIVSAPAAGGPAGLGDTFDSTGLSALRHLERAGLVKQMIPLVRQWESREASIAGRLGVVAAFGGAKGLSTSLAVDAGTSLEGTSIVELERDDDVESLQISLANDPNIEFVSRVPARYLVARAPSRGKRVSAAPPPASTMWNLEKIQWAKARSLPNFEEATDIRVAVLDTGVDLEHPDLDGRVSGYFFDHPDLPRTSSDRDIIGHGTHVSGTIAASSNNFLGINGICHCQLWIWKIFDDVADYNPALNQFTYYVNPVMYRRALAECLEQGIDVINLSIGGPGRPDPQEQGLLNALLANGTTIVAAMGNERQYGSPTSYPAAVGGVIAVGATRLDDRVANFSNRGNHISISAPGIAIWSTLPTYPGHGGFAAVPGPSGAPIEGKAMRRETDYDAWQGTSMASPHVAGAAALLLANKGKMKAASVRTRLTRAADRVAGMGKRKIHPDYGAGRLNLLKLLK